MAASELLWGASGRQFGSCSVTIRPCSRRCHEQPYGGWWWRTSSFVSGWPYGPVSGGFADAVCGRCTGGCACSSAAEFRLPFQVQSIKEITIDGDVLPPSGYVLVPDGVTLVRADGGEWPLCQDWAATSGPGVFEVTAVFGEPVPALGALAMGEVIPEMLKACTGSGDCKLPSGTVQSVTRQGVTKVFVDPSKLAELRSIGLPLADKFVQTFNPHHLDSGPRIWNPDDVLEGRDRGSRL